MQRRRISGTQLIIAAKLGGCSPSQLAETERLGVEVGRMLNGLSKYLKTVPAEPTKN